jgi:hypothetical protein
MTKQPKSKAVGFKECCICSIPMANGGTTRKRIYQDIMRMEISLTHYDAYPFGTIDNGRCCAFCYTNIVVATRISQHNEEMVSQEQELSNQ